ncbi:MAG: bifunctional ornithine acetyltransferase/N-acetylglutamate synthase [Firmicutes bacterium]|nr:bifunctional ornithine acetyltransferase/N-acetylglutamate synthase [Bacillota bacterium]
MNDMQEKIKEVAGGITAARGYLAAGIRSGCKNGKRDLALLYSQHPATAAGVFTQNKVKAHPLLLTRERVAKGSARAVVINSGNANACNGSGGMEDARKMTAEVSRLMGMEEESVVVASTGVIGQPMPMDKIIPGIEVAVSELNADGGADAAEAIMTTDTVIKETAVAVEMGGVRVTIGGMAKGSGMIHPNMATMLGFITTDAVVSPKALKAALGYAVERSFNMITVDGDTSTNDMVLVMANGAAGGPELSTDSKEFIVFQKALLEVCNRLAKMVARDGEGATKLLEVKVSNAGTEEDARLAAKAVASSSLVKSAIFGRDANWGRILCAVGYSGAEFDPQKVDIFIGAEQVARAGGALNFSEENALQILAADEVVIAVDMKTGRFGATAWGCDLTYDYVKINADYRT